MRVTPKTEKEIALQNLLPKGWYPMTIGEAEEKKSKKGNEMIVLNVKVYKEEGFIFVKDYLMDTEFGAGKLRHCAETCGLLLAYESGELNAEDMQHCEGFVKIGVEKSKDDQYPDKNKIIEYRKEKPVPKGGSTAPDSGDDAPSEDDIPFN